MRDANLNFSAEELAVVYNAEFILTKQAVINKVVYFFGELSDVYSKILQCYLHLPEEVFKQHAKISKGEQYHSLPYVILDQPRLFDNENIFAIRSFFWWGNFLSITLHVGGSFLNRFPLLTGKIKTLHENDWYWCINDDAWQHHFKEENYILIKNMQEELISEKRNFIKISRKLPLQQWNNAETFFTESYRQLLQLIS